MHTTVLSRETTLPHKKWEPPTINTAIQCQKPFNFDMKSDFTYFLSLKMFNPKYRDVVQLSTHVDSETGTCPYFTGEFKKTN